MLCFDFIMSLKVQNSLLIIAMLSSDGTHSNVDLTHQSLDLLLCVRLKHSQKAGFNAKY